MAIRKAARQFRPLKIGIGGITGSGKTRGALRLAFGICGDWNRICVLDTENKSADLYAGLGGFSVIEPADNSPAAYCGAIKEVVDAEGFDVLIIDSLTHEWAGKGGLLEVVDKMQDTNKGANSFTVWGKATPIHNAFVDAWLGLPMHVIGTMRKKDEYVIEQNDRGKAVPKKVGLKNIQRDGLDYEFDILLDIHSNHHCSVQKDRTMTLDGKPPFQLDEKLGKQLVEWSRSGAATAVLSPEKSDETTISAQTGEKLPPPVVKVAPTSAVFEGKPEQIAAIESALTRMKLPAEKWPMVIEKMVGKTGSHLQEVVRSLEAAV